MNDVQFVETARKLAERMLHEGGSQPADRLEWGFRLVTGRNPTTAEMGILRSILEQQITRYTANPAAAEELLKVGAAPRDASLPAVELAAYAMMANLLFNLDEAVTKE